jgi:hypothetical protein
MAHYGGGETTREDVTIIGKKGPRGGSTLKSQQVCNLKFHVTKKILVIFLF